MTCWNLHGDAAKPIGDANGLQATNLQRQCWAHMNCRKIIPTQTETQPGLCHRDFMFHNASYKYSCLTSICALLYADLWAQQMQVCMECIFFQRKLTEETVHVNTQNAMWGGRGIKFALQSSPGLSTIKSKFPKETISPYLSLLYGIVQTSC